MLSWLNWAPVSLPAGLISVLSALVLILRQSHCWELLAENVRLQSLNKETTNWWKNNIITSMYMAFPDSTDIVPDRAIT